MATTFFLPHSSSLVRREIHNRYAAELVDQQLFRDDRGAVRRLLD
jgi:hypothetical protein